MFQMINITYLIYFFIKYQFLKYNVKKIISTKLISIILQRKLYFSFEKEVGCFLTQISYQSHVVIVYRKKDFNIESIIYLKNLTSNNHSWFFMEQELSKLLNSIF